MAARQDASAQEKDSVIRYVIAVLVITADVTAAQELPKGTNDLKTLTVQQAKALAQHEGRLALRGLTTLSDEAARATAQHKGELYLDGLTTLSDEAATVLRANPEIRLPDKFKR